MNKTLLLVLILGLFYKVGNAQTRTGDFDVALYRHSDFSKKTLKRFKSDVVYFSFGKSIEPEYEKILKEVWTFTPYQLIKREDEFDIIKENVSICRFNTTTVERKETVTKAYPVIDFTVIDKTKIDKNGILTFKDSRVASIYLLREYSNKNNYLNFKPGFIKNYLQQVNNSLVLGEPIKMYGQNKVDNQIKLLKNKVLYVPNYLKDARIESYVYGIKNKTKFSYEKLLEDYGFEYEVIEVDKLSDMIVNSKEPIYYFMYHNINANKIITITNSLTGEIIYQDHTKQSLNIKSKDFEKIAKEISKS